MDPILLVLAVASGAAVAAGLGALPLLGRTDIPARWLAWANAGAAGMMLAGSFLLFDAGVGEETPAFAVGAVLGILFIAGSQWLSKTSELGRDILDDSDPSYGYQVMLDGSLHSSAEGVAFGAMMAVEPALGVFFAVAMSVHNIPEGTLLAAVFRSRGASLGRAALLAVVSKATQVLLAVTTLAVVQAAAPVLPWAMGFSAGALVFLVMVDLLPESYREAGATSIAIVAGLAMGLFALLHAWLRGSG